MVMIELSVQGERRKASMADILVGVCYGPPNQDAAAHRIFYKQLKI